MTRFPSFPAHWFGRPRLGLAPLAAVLALGACASGTGGEQTLVDRATLTLQEMMAQNVSQDPKRLLRQAKGAMICPRVFKAGFFVGGEGGSCVLLARSGNGTWSYPTFYDIGSGSFGFQFGIQDSQLLLLIMTSRGLGAVMDSQVRLGGNISVAVATVGAGVQGSTTTAVGADIVAFAATRGLFGGVSLEGSVMTTRVDGNQAYYGQPLGARQIVVQMQGTNPGADPLREALTRFGGAEPETPGGSPGGAPGGYGGPPPAPGGGYAPPPRTPPDERPPSAPSRPRGASVPPGYQRPDRPSAYAPPIAPPSGYQPPAGQYTYPPGGAPTDGPIQEQSLPPPRR